MNVRKLHAPAAERNREAIAAALASLLPATGRVLEIASGTGQHALHFAGRFPHLEWQPTDVDAASLASIEAYRAEAGLVNLLAPVLLDVIEPTWNVERADAIVCSNMIHISPWATCEGLFGGAGRLLPAGGVVALYGPFRFEGRFTAPSNAAFDESLKSRDPRWGVRDVVDIDRVAASSGFEHQATLEMPANNHLLAFRRNGSP